jgi:Zn-dependent peptidase ImmA (M78 family)
MNLRGDVFIGERLQIAREFRGLTQTQLGEKVAASPALVSLCEGNKKREPSGDLVEAFGEVLGFGPDFFYSDLKDIFLESECNFRHRRSAAERLKARVRAHGTLLGIVVAKLRTLFKFPKFDVPVIAAMEVEEIERAAETCREHWRLGLDSPILHVGRILENAGVPIITNVMQAKEIDAFSRKGQTTLIFLNQFVPSTSRWAFDIAHECGHLVMHSGIQTGSKETEAAADRFASSFLLPRYAFTREFGRVNRISWPHVFEMKRRWRVSVAAIIRRSYHLGLLNAVGYRQAYKYISFKGWNVGEPQEADFKAPELFVPALQSLGKKVKLTLNELCNEMHFQPETFREVTGVEIPRLVSGKNVVQFRSEV